MNSFIALIRKDADSDFGVSFPDFPSCTIAGRSLEEAHTFAQEALAIHFEGIKEDGEALPSPSSLCKIMRHPDFADGVAFLVEH